MIVPSCLFLKFYVFEISISIVMNPIVLYFPKFVLNYVTAFIFRVFREYFEKKEKAETIGTCFS